MRLNHGILITFEGLEGSGKTTQMRKLAYALRRMNYRVATTFEPGDCRLGRKLRRILMEKRMRFLSPEAEVFLFLADRAQHVHEVILPALRQKKIVLCDRYVDSTIAYQAFGRLLPPRFLHGMNQFAVSGLCPNATFFLDVEIPLGLKRIKKRKQKNLLDKESLKFYARVRKGYQAVARKNRRIFMIDASQREEVVQSQILERVKNLLDRL